MSQTTLDSLGKLILRLAVGILILLHGIYKLNHGISGIEGMLAAKGWPAVLAWGVYAGEILGPLLVILGIYARLGGALIAGNMVVAILLAHMGQLGLLNDMGGWQLELQGMFLAGGLAIAMIGAGRFSLAGGRGRFN